MSELSDHSNCDHSDKCANNSNHNSKKLRKTSKNNSDNANNGNCNNNNRLNQFDKTLNFLPKLFIRCHCKNNDAFDNNTSIWSATFQPPSKLSNGSEFVATCGGNSVCVLDVKNANNSKNVISRFIDDDKSEEFVSLAWNVLPNTENSDNTSTTSDEKLILAVGGKRQILLMFTIELSCYERIDAHDDQINALLFHKTDPFLLFSISYDHKIKLWRISANNANKSKLLKYIDTRSPLLSLCHSLEYDCIIVSGFKGVMFWCDISRDNNDHCLGQLCANQMVDGLVIIPDDPSTLALRACNTKFITVIDLKSTIDEIKANTRLINSARKQISLSKVQKFQLNWSDDCQYPFIYMSAQNGILVSGAPNGQMYLYNTGKFESYAKSNQIGDPDFIVDWPSIENLLQDNKYVIDDKKFVIINAVAISPDLKYIVGCTNLNLVCIWYRH